MIITVAQACFLFGGMIMSSHAAEKAASAKRADLAAVSKIAASGITKVVDGSASPDKRLAVGVGSVDGSKPEWEELEGDGGAHSFILKDDVGCGGTYLIDVQADRVTGILDGSHFGTRSEYNHESYDLSWSDDSRWLLEVQSWKWSTSVCVVHRLDARGALNARLDFKPVATGVVAAWLHTHYPKLSAKEIRSYAVTIQEDARISNDGSITVKIEAQIPKDEGDHPYVRLIAVAKVERPKNGALTAKVTSVEAIKDEHE